MARDGADDSTTRTGSGLRTRVLRGQAKSESAAVFGAAHANAYFNARRLKQSTGQGQQQQKRRKTDDAQHDKVVTKQTTNDDDDAGTRTTTTTSGFAVRPVAEIVEILRQADEQEDAWRRRKPTRQWPAYDHLFPKWASQLLANYSILLHGVGSKLGLLQSFAGALPASDFVVQVHGYLPAIDLDETVTMLHDEVFAMRETTRAPQSLLHRCRDIDEFARSHRHHEYPHVYVIVHSLDGPALRHPDNQACLARLSMVPFVHLIASIDSVNAPALWADEGAQRYRWLHHHVDTLRPYVREIDLRMNRQGKAAKQSISGVRYIMQSLTPTDVATLRTIAQQQLVCASSSTSRSRRVEKCADYHGIYVACRKQLVHSTMQAMKNSVKCLQDNGLVRLIRVSNVEKLLIPLADEVLRQDIMAVDKPESKTAAMATTGK